MRFLIGLKDISAFLVDGDFDWRKQYNVNTTTGRLHDVNANLLKDSESTESAGDFAGKEGGASQNVQDVDSISRDSQSQEKSNNEVDVGEGDLYFLPMLEKTGMAVALEQVTLTLILGREPSLQLSIYFPFYFIFDGQI